MLKEPRRIKQQRITRARRSRARLHITPAQPRVIVRRSNRYIYACIVGADGRVLVSASSMKLAGKPIERATQVGSLLATAAKEAKITKVVLDRGRYRYHGQVKALAEGARTGGLIF